MSTTDHPIRALLLGLVLGAGLTLCVFPDGFSFASLVPEPPSLPPIQTLDPPASWPPLELDYQSGWRRLVFDENGWSTEPAGSYTDLDRSLDRLASGDRELVIPMLPTVYVPDIQDKIYYDAILDSDIAPGDKVLVIGTGSGADAWAAWLKSQAPVYVIEVNPMAVINAKVTARIAGFPIKPMVGDFREVDLPDEYHDFDYVLWNMPFVEINATPEDFERRNFHDGDDGDVLQAFLARLPSLLTEDGTAIVLNYALAREQIDLPGVVTRVDDGVTEITDTTYMLFTIPNPGTPE